MNARAPQRTDDLRHDRARLQDISRIHDLLAAHPDDCILMERREIVAALRHFRVVRDDLGTAVACAGLLPLDRRRSEIRGVVVDADHRGLGLGAAIVEQLVRDGRQQGREVVCVSRHPEFFEQLGFERIGLDEVPEKDAVTNGTKPRCALVYKEESS